MTHERPPYPAAEIDKANAHLESLIRVLKRSSSQEEVRLRAENVELRAENARLMARITEDGAAAGWR